YRHTIPRLSTTGKIGRPMCSSQALAKTTFNKDANGSVRSAPADLARQTRALCDAARAGPLDWRPHLMARGARRRRVSGLAGGGGRLGFRRFRARGGGLGFVLLQTAVLVLFSRSAVTRIVASRSSGAHHGECSRRQKPGRLMPSFCIFAWRVV